MTEKQMNQTLGWIRRFQNFDLEADSALADIEKSSARICELSEHVIGKMDFGTEPSGYLRLLEQSGRGSDDDAK